MAATAGCKKGKGKTGDRQKLHEIIRQHSQAAAREVKMKGRPNDLIERLAGEPAFADVDLKKALEAGRFVGLAPQQVDRFLSDVVRPILTRYRSVRNKTAKLNV